MFFNLHAIDASRPLRLYEMSVAVPVGNLEPAMCPACAIPLVEFCQSGKVIFMCDRCLQVWPTSQSSMVTSTRQAVKQIIPLIELEIADVAKESTMSGSNNGGIIRLDESGQIIPDGQPEEEAVQGAALPQKRRGRPPRNGASAPSKQRNDAAPVKRNIFRIPIEQIPSPRIPNRSKWAPLYEDLMRDLVLAAESDAVGHRFDDEKTANYVKSAVMKMAERDYGLGAVVVKVRRDGEEYTVYLYRGANWKKSK
jgi:hypothetical protein